MEKQLVQGSAVITTISLNEWLLKKATPQEKEAVIEASNEGVVYSGAIVVNGELRVAI
jgi:hypothetical protein